MTKPRLEPARGAPAHRGRRRSRSVASLLVLALLATLGVVTNAPAPAGADLVTTTTDLELNCIATPPVVAPLEVTQALAIDIEHPDEVPRNEVQTITITQPPLEVPTDLDGNTVINLNSINVAFKVDPQFRIEAARLVGGDVPGTAPSVNASPSGDVIFTVPGPLLGGQTYQLPTVELDVRAVGTVGTSGSVYFNTFNLVARANLPIVGAQDVPVACPTPNPNPALFSVLVAPGEFITTPDPVVTTTDLDQRTVVKYGSTIVPGSAGTTANPFSVTTSALPDVAPGSSAAVQLAVGPRDWLAPYRASPHQTLSEVLSLGARDIIDIQNWQMTFAGPDPAKFTVTGVTSADPTSMTATYNAATNRIVLARPAGAAGALGQNQTFAPPTVTVELQAVGPDGQPPATLSFVSMGFSLRFRSVSCVIFLGCSFGNPQTLNATTQAPANVGGSPVGTQPNNTVFFQPITAQPTVGSIGIVVPPTAVADSTTVANNEAVDIDVLANDVAGTLPINPGSVFLVDEPVHGTAVVDPATGVVTYTPEHGTLEPEDGFTYVIQDTEGRYSNVVSVFVRIVGIYCEAPCSLTQTIIVDVDPDVLTMEQAGGAVELDTVVLDGDAQTVTAALQEVIVTNERGGTAPWDVTGQLTSDFKTEAGSPECPAADPSSWYWLCVPGDNLGWDPLAIVAHQQVPGDVAVAEAGSATSSGLRSDAQKLCGAPATESGGTFGCGALVGLGVPASAGAGRYSATLTLTLA